ncbi:MAG: hypothetical protein FWC77_07280 [Defluviitaleaceae bacterium]|nr:hypothetical protein [Defluviitaleaceae bacterium]
MDKENDNGKKATNSNENPQLKNTENENDLSNDTADNHSVSEMAIEIADLRKDEHTMSISNKTSLENKRLEETTVGDSKAVAEADVVTMLYTELNKFFGSGNQLFTLEMPGRVLNQLDYAYPIENHNSSLLAKPYTVAENEFRLTNNMIDVAPIVQGPNGTRLSNAYFSAINNYIPRLKHLKDFIVDKMNLRLFLLQEITDVVDGKEITCSRMEFCQMMYMRYLREKYAWDQEKIDKHIKAKTADELDDYARWLATVAWTKDHELAGLFNDAVVRGYYHEIMTILGFLDVASPAGLLSAVKQNRRASARRSMDASMDVLPVQMQPSNWFRSLSPNFAPTDLTLGKDFLELELQAKQKLLSSLQAELRTLLNRHVGADELKSLEDAIRKAREGLEENEREFMKTYGAAAFNAAKVLLEVYTNGNMTKLPDVKITKEQKDSFAAVVGISEADAQKLIDGMVALYVNHMNYFVMFNELIELQRIMAQSMTRNHSHQIGIISERINLISREINQLQVILMSAIVKPSASNNDDSLLPIPRYNESNEFMEIVFSKKTLDTMMEKTEVSTFSQLRGSIGAFFINMSTNIESSMAQNKFISEMLKTDFTIGLRATKVTIDRGGWFDPHILTISQEYQRLNHSLAGAGLTVDKIYREFSNNDIFGSSGSFAATKDLTTAPDGTPYTFPAFPTSFVIVKDVVIKATMSASNEKDFKEFRKESSSAGASIFGMRLSGGSSRQSFMDYNKKSEGVVNYFIRIPGPQILAWFLQLPNMDMAVPYESLSDSEFYDEVMGSIKEFGDKLNDLNRHKNQRQSAEGVEITTVTLP